MRRVVIVAAAALAGVVAPAPLWAAGAGMVHAVLAAGPDGEAGASGTLTADIDAESGDFCYQLAVEKISGDPVGRLEDKGGKKLAELDVTGQDDDACIALQPDLLKAILAAPGDYTVVVANSEHKKGAASGALLSQ